MIISLHNRSNSIDLYSRLVWQVLFNDYRENGGFLNVMDDILCNLSDIKELFGTYKDFTFYWWHSNHLTDLTFQRETHRRQLKVQYVHAERKVEITTLPSEVNPIFLT